MLKNVLWQQNLKIPIPQNDLEKIIRDADSSHFGKDYFEEASEFLRQEYINQNIHNFTPKEWLKENIKVLVENHQFYTDYALKKLATRKRRKSCQFNEKAQKEHKKI